MYICCIDKLLVILNMVFCISLFVAVYVCVAYVVCFTLVWKYSNAECRSLTNKSMLFPC